MFKENGSLYTMQELQDIYQIKTNFLTYNGLVASINSLKSTIQNSVNLKKLIYPFMPNYCWLFFKSNRGCSDFYNLLNKNNAVPTSKAKWELLYNIEDATWKDIYSLPFKLGVGSQLQWFQVRINHRLLPTKSYLYKIKVKDSPFA